MSCIKKKHQSTFWPGMSLSPTPALSTTTRTLTMVMSKYVTCTSMIIKGKDALTRSKQFFIVKNTEYEGAT